MTNRTLPTVAQAEGVVPPQARQIAQLGEDVLAVVPRLLVAGVWKDRHGCLLVAAAYRLDAKGAGEALASVEGN